MRIKNATLYALKIPFVESFSHATKTRGFSDSIIVRLTTENDIVGYGEGVPRPYVTGEDVESSLQYMRGHLWSDRRKQSFLDGEQAVLGVFYGCQRWSKRTFLSDMK
jgi:L-alanine-DL-glutamate epimerase-like enolase superfamily enzyme